MSNNRMTKNEIVQEIAAELPSGVTPRKIVTHVLERLSDMAYGEIADGRDFAVPGILTISYRYTAPRKKGDVYVGFGGEETVAESARPARLGISKSINREILQAAKKNIADPKSAMFKSIAKRKGGSK